MKKRLAFFIIFTTIFIAIFFFQTSNSEKFLNGMTEKEVDEVLGLIRENTEEEKIITFGDFVKRESLINLVHITKSDLGYKVSCFLGSAYKEAGLNKIFPEKLVSMGQIKECNVETAEAIDKAVKSQKIECAVFMGPTPSTLDDYYFFAITVKRREITQEWIDLLNKKWLGSGEDALRCFKPMEELLGETIAKHGTGIVDLNQGVVYY